ncbi:aldehyde dehydrogenase (NADP(+)) [Agromyces marinus]|uniref:Aldehyde dehydrogenase n=1 Tax=Agromyces marinus TaxID=1389020 RepID=A0ABN6Y9T8_9MICO|nr:aldehyde dehydrogenase (NADP(+)) [Agromyces marinus]UIP57738.1 Alpha-ketoglutaric semialdehyde dehydrogenase [Agromyces marinus]BDZ54089.1 aldehyde dehydrogenase [Agromyces marinus]
MLSSTNPRTGESRPTGIAACTPDEADRVIRAADAAFEDASAEDRLWRAGLLDALADALDANRDELAAIADRETGLGLPRLTGEVGRSSFQFRLFADAVREGSHLEATIDRAATTPLGPQPEIRRMLVPIGTVAVFGSSNFPFAFSVAGGDTASALAAGNAVVLKAHSSHLETSRASHAVLRDAAAAYGAPDGLIGIVYGTEAGRVLVSHPLVQAVGFTGSLGGGRALMDLIDERPRPIPFYGELSSLNPLIITPAAAVARGEAIADGLYGSFTLGSGQFCTKPGVAFVPVGEAGDALVARIAAKAADAASAVLLNERIAASFDEIRDRVTAGGTVDVLAQGVVEPGAGFTAAPTVLATTAAELTAEATEEVFGPLIVIVRYREDAEIVRALDAVPDSLTATVHSEASDAGAVAALVRELAPRVGRLVFDGYPTGVRVSWGQHHGGPWPSTNSQHTSVGVSAIRRFLRPLAWQDAPEALLPAELRDGYEGIPRRVDGVLQLG